jgi:hypothetical protein
VAANALDRIKSAASGAVVIGTAVAARAARTAGPLVGKALGAIKSRVGDSPKPPRGTDPVTVTPAPARPAQPARPAEPATAVPTKPGTATPTPAAVAKNIPPHPPQPASKTKKPVKKAAPGAKLPPRRKTEGT